MNIFLKLKNNQSEFAKLLALAALVSASFAYGLNFFNTAVTWPASDNLAAVCRLLQATCLGEDFFTNASSGITPRLPYVYFLSEITRIANNGIGGGLAIVKSLILIFLPIVVSFLFIASVKTHIDYEENKQWGMSPAIIIAVISAPLFVFLLQGNIGLRMSVAWWPPLNFEAHAHNVSLLLTLFGFLLFWLGRKNVGAAIIVLGAIVHPVVGLFASVFSCIVLGKFNTVDKDLRFVGIGLGASLAGVILAKLLFGGDGAISTQDFVRVYALEAHPAHYIPSQFGSLSPMPWWVSFAIVAVGLLTITILLYKLKSAVWKNSFIAFVAYFSSVLIQFLFVEVVQIKLVAALGPSRFTMFGPWFLFVFCFIALLKFFDGNCFFKTTANVIHRCLVRIHWIYILPCYFILGASAVIYAHKSGYFNLPDDAKTLFKFAGAKTNINDVFVLPFYAPRVEFPLVTGRAIFSGNGFPFSEKYFLEWEDRNAIAYGRNAEIMKFPGSWIGEKWANHYRWLSPKDFLEATAKYKIDWVVIEAEYSQKFSDCRHAIPHNSF